MTDPAGPVLVLSAPEDVTADVVENYLRDRRVPVVRMDTGDFPARMRLDARNVDGQWAGSISTPEASVELDRVRAIYYRRPTRFRLPTGLAGMDSAFALTEAKLGMGGMLASLSVTWVNHPARIAIAEYKPQQLAVADRLGFAVPRTVITNDAEVLRSFAAEIAGPVVCKTFSSLVLGGDEPAAVFTTTVDPAAIDAEQLAATAHLFQERIPKDHDVRVTMVGHTVFAAAMLAETPAGREDWRADYQHLSYAPVSVPDEVRKAMITYLDHFGLNYGAFDFVVEPSGSWCFLECNPNGQWLWLEKELGQPIAATIAALLADPETSR